MRASEHPETDFRRYRQRAAYWPPAPAAFRRSAGWLEAGLDAAALLFFPLLVLAPRGIAPLASVAGLLAGGRVLAAGVPAWRPALAAPAALLGSLLVWGIVSAVWAIHPLRSLDMAARLAGLFAAGLALTAVADLLKAPRRLTWFLLGGFVLGIVMAATDFATRGALSSPFSARVYQPAWLNQASVAFAILLLPASAVPLGRGLKVRAFLLAAAGVVTIYSLAGTAAKAALTAGLVMALVLYISRTCAARAAAAVSILLIISAPLTFARLERLPAITETADAIKQSAGHRLLIWSFAGDRIAEHAIIGWGLDSSRAIPGGRDPIEPGETWLPLHPHNAPLQLWLELGVPGAVLFALVTASAWLALAAADWPRLFAAAAGGGLAAAFVACLGTYGIWQEWWQGTLWFSLFLVLVMARAALHPDQGR